MIDHGEKEAASVEGSMVEITSDDAEYLIEFSAAGKTCVGCRMVNRRSTISCG